VTLATSCPKPAKKNKSAKKKRNWLRAYGSKDRADWMKTLRCVVTLRYGTEDDPIDNVHIETGGVSRKADAEKVVPMLRSKHRELHAIGQKTFARKYPWINLEELAAETERLWQAHLNTMGK
jgi:hypothetical protein